MERPPFPIAVDSSMISSFMDCPRKFQYQYLNHWARKGGSVHLVAGGAFARGCEVIRKSFYDEHKPFDECLTDGIAAATAAYGDYEVEPDHPKSLERILMGLLHYFTTFPPATDHVQPLKVADHHAIEFTFALPLEVRHPETGDPLIYCGRNDMLVEYNGSVFVLDDKTTSQLGASWPGSWNLRGQLDGYVWAAQTMGYNPAGAIVRGISFLKRGFGTAESLQTRSRWQIERWYDQTHRNIERMISAWKAGYFDYALGTACTSYGGCSYSRLCSVPNPEAWWDQDFEVRVWNPLELKAPSEG